MPATSIVVISWTSFWLERSAIPARVSLGVTTVLSITTLLSNSNDNLPPTAYPKVGTGLGKFLKLPPVPSPPVLKNGGPGTRYRSSVQVQVLIMYGSQKLDLQSVTACYRS